MDPLFQVDYIRQDEVDKFAEYLLDDPDNEIVERLSALTDFFPIDASVQRRRLRKKRSIEQRREGFIYQLIRWPVLVRTALYLDRLAHFRSSYSPSLS